LVPSLKNIFQLETPSLLSNSIYTLLSVALTVILLVIIPHSIHKDIEQQSIHPTGLNIGPELSLHIDSANNMSVNNILNRTSEITQPFKGHTWLKLQLSSEPVWLKFPVKWTPNPPASLASLELYIDLGFATLNDVTLTVVDEFNNVVVKQRSGDHIKESQRPVPTSHPIFNFTIEQGKLYQVLVRIDTDSFLNTSIAVSTGKQALLRTHHLNFLLGIFYGCLGMIFFYNLFILILTRRRSYLYYVLYLFFLFCYQGIFDGVIGQYLWSQPGWFLDRSLVYFAGLANLMALLFVRTILRLPDLAPTLNAWVNKFILLISISFIIELVYPSNFSSLWMMVTVIAFCLLLPILGVVAWRRGSTLAKSYFVAWMSYPVLVGVYVLCMAGIVPTNYDTLNSLRVGSTIQAVLMSFALAYYISELRLKKTSLQRALYDELESQIDQMSQTTRALSQGDYNVRSSIDYDARLGSLAQDFNSLADALEDAQSQRERWLADISHELRTPLTVFRGSLESMQTGVIPVNSTSLQLLIDESNRINRLVDDLHDLSLLESQEMRFHPVMVEINIVIESVISSHSKELASKPIRVSVKAEKPAISVYVDVDRITQVFINLMANTIKYTDTPGELTITINRIKDQVLIRWIDSKPGVKPEDLDKLFTRLYRAESSRNRKTGGAGLGLSLSRAIIIHSGGTITAEPSPLGGVQFNITLPTRGNHTP
tara:strand:+ start:12392 stop:14527 length:2136 start_codon:yes stop_codon:yes gene_type:complete